jgi:hypothetical protein
MFPGGSCDAGPLAFSRLEDPPADWTLQADGFKAPTGHVYCSAARSKLDVCVPLTYAPELCDQRELQPCPAGGCETDPWVYPPDTRAAVALSQTERCAATGQGLFCGPSGAAKLVAPGSLRLLQRLYDEAVIALGDAGLAYHMDKSRQVTRLSAGTGDFVALIGNAYLGWAAMTREGHLVLGDGADAAACTLSEHVTSLISPYNRMYFATKEGTVGDLGDPQCARIPEPIQGLSAQYCGIAAGPIVYGTTHAWFSRTGCAYD